MEVFGSMPKCLTAKLVAGGLALVLLVSLPFAASASVAKRKASVRRSGAKLTPSERAGIPPEAFGSPVRSPDGSRCAWIADDGDGPNLYVGKADRTQKVAVTHYRFSPAHDLMPGIPILWSPDGRYVAYYEYSHSAIHPTTSSRAVVVAADGSANPTRVTQPGAQYNTRPTRWVSDRQLRFKGLREANVTAPEDPFVFDLSTGLAQTEADFLAAQARLRGASSDSASSRRGRR